MNKIKNNFFFFWHLQSQRQTKKQINTRRKHTFAQGILQGGENITPRRKLKL